MEYPQISQLPDDIWVRRYLAYWREMPAAKLANDDPLLEGWHFSIVHDQRGVLVLFAMHPDHAALYAPLTSVYGSDGFLDGDSAPKNDSQISDCLQAHLTIGFMTIIDLIKSGEY